MPTRTELERAAANVIGILKSISEYSEARIAIIGGLALWKYIPNGRTTQVIAFSYSQSLHTKLTWLLGC
jgi:hypothetical protein